MLNETITIANRFRGPPASGNGGYVAGAVAAVLNAGENPPAPCAAEVTLRSPVPLDMPLETKRDNGLLMVRHGETLVAEATHVALTLAIPAAPGYAQALAAQGRSPALIRNISRRFPDRIGVHPVCFCCGAEHEAGLKVHAAAISGTDIVAAAWQTQRAWADHAGHLPDTFVWTALDCPGQFAYHANGIRTGMLGRLCARVERPIAAGERCVVTGWRIGIEGRKHYAGTAVFNEAGMLCAYAKAVWIGRKEQ